MNYVSELSQGHVNDIRFFDYRSYVITQRDDEIETISWLRIIEFLHSQLLTRKSFQEHWNRFVRSIIQRPSKNGF